ncbi:MAG TPA: alcohol dehydrogenase catalytic domain-containing protein, partial [Chthoniobacterales bacterium]|nr:alcohol dehydrogenase catalytic domain-containing protein [Chthoniobacterales bacterium]
MRYHSSMRAMRLHGAGEPLVADEMPVPEIRNGQLLVRVNACAVCRTDLHIVDGELSEPKLPLVPGHEIVGRVEEIGSGVHNFRVGDRVGIPWLGWTCGECEYCVSGRENLCERARFTGYTIDGGYAEFTVVDARFAFHLPDVFDEVSSAPLLCAGLIGYRSLRKAGEPKRLGIYGFGAAAHIVAQVSRFEGREIFAFTRQGDNGAQEFARGLGAIWAGGSD